MAKDPVYYKVLDHNNNPAHGGKCVYSLPTKTKPGNWMPNVLVNPYYSGYHLTTSLHIRRWLIGGGQLYIAEGRGNYAHYNDKHVFSSVRLIKKVGTLPDSAYSFDRYEQTELDRILRNSISFERFIAEQKEFRKICIDAIKSFGDYTVDDDSSAIKGYVFGQPDFKKFGKKKLERLIYFIETQY